MKTMFLQGEIRVNMSVVKIKKGIRFNHKHFLCTKAYDGKTPQLMEITLVTKNTVYYRVVRNYLGREDLGTCFHISKANFLDCVMDFV